MGQALSETGLKRERHLIKTGNLGGLKALNGTRNFKWETLVIEKGRP